MPLDPRYVMMQLPGEASHEFVLIQAFTPANKQNLVAWIAARSDGEHYGELSLYLFPRDRTVMGPQQADTSINQNPDISRDVSFWDQHGSKVKWGNLITLPLLGKEQGTVIYVKPLYLESAQGGKIPALTKVILVQGEGKRPIEANTLQEGLAQLYGGDAPASQQAKPTTEQQQAQPEVVKIAIDLSKLSKDQLIDLAKLVMEELRRR